MAPARKPSLPPRRRAAARRPAAAAQRSVLEHELHVHQEELRAQNEKLVAALVTLEEARDRFIELYDFAPSGYLTLDAHGVIRESNLSAAAMLGRARQELIGFPFIGYLDRGHRTRFLTYLRACRDHRDGAWPREEFVLRAEGGVRTVQLECNPRTVALKPRELFVAMTDVTDRKRLEEERERLQRQHAELVRQMMSIQESERRRIAHDIHDDLGQQVTGLRLKLEWLASSTHSDAELGSKIAVVQEQAAQLDRHVDVLLRQLRPAGLDIGLEAALRQAVSDWSLMFGIPVEFQTSGLEGLQLPPETETHLFRIVQEALNNVHKHARATRVRLALVRREARLTLVVQDDGVGLPPPEAPTAVARRGLGLLGMQERATLIGAVLQVRSRARRGVTLTLELPAAGGQP